MPAAIGHRERPGRDCQGLLRRIAGRGLSLAGEDLSDVIVERNGLDANAAVGESTADSNLLHRHRRLGHW